MQKKANDNDGIKQLPSHLCSEELLREMTVSGHDVSGPMTELVALKTTLHTRRNEDAVRTGLEFCTIPH